VPTSIGLLTARVELLLTPDEARVIENLRQRFGTSQAAIARLLVKEGIRRIERLGAFTVEEVDAKAP